MLTEFLWLALANTLVILILFFCVWVLSVAIKDSSIADIFWGLGFVAVVWFTWAISEGVEERRLLVAVLTTIWGVRLGAYIAWRNWGAEDPRYARFRQHVESQGKNYAVHSLVHIYLLQGLYMCVTALVLIFAMAMDTPEQLGWLAWAGTALWVIGMFFETVGDAQLTRFKSDPANEGKILDRGLWRYTRHPNYFGEACIWIGFFLIAAENLLGLITIISPITIIYAVAGPSGKALLERRMSKKRPDFEDYKRRTSGFFPMPPKKQTRLRTDVIVTPRERTMSSETNERLQRMLDHSEIRDVLARYARGIDRADGELLKTCYHADAIEEHAGNYEGNAHQYIDEAMPRVMQLGTMQHLLGSSHIDIDGNKAYVETYVWTFVRLEDNGRDVDTFTGGRLMDRFEKRDGEWKIAHRWTILDWNRDTASSEGWCLGMFDFSQKGARVGCKGKDDPSYERF